MRIMGLVGRLGSIRSWMFKGLLVFFREGGHRERRMVEDGKERDERIDKSCI